MSFTRLNTYQQLAQRVAAFTADDSDFTSLVIAGAPGTGKTTLRRTLEDAHIIENTGTAYGLYKEVYEHMNTDIIVLDDVDNLWKEKRAISLLKSLLQTDREKSIQWNTAQADRDKLPRRFTTKARFMILCNTIDGNGDNFKAVISRVIGGYEFFPSPREVHAEAGRIKEKHPNKIDNEVYETIGKNLMYIAQPDLRDYIVSSIKKRSGLPWFEELTNRWFKDAKLAYAVMIVNKAEAGDTNYAEADQRANKFERAGHGVRSTYFEYQKKVLEIAGKKRVEVPKNPKQYKEKCDEIRLRQEIYRREGYIKTLSANGFDKATLESYTLEQLMALANLEYAKQSLASSQRSFDKLLNDRTSGLEPAIEPKSESPTILLLPEKSGSPTELISPETAAKSESPTITKLPDDQLLQTLTKVVPIAEAKEGDLIELASPELTIMNAAIQRRRNKGLKIRVKKYGYRTDFPRYNTLTDADVDKMSDAELTDEIRQLCPTSLKHVGLDKSTIMEASAKVKREIIQTLAYCVQSGSPTETKLLQAPKSESPAVSEATSNTDLMAGLM